MMSKGEEDLCCSLFTIKSFLMESLRYGIGIDVAKDKFDVCLCSIDDEQQVKFKASRSFDNSITGFEAFILWIKKKSTEHIPIKILMEATGIYYEQLAWHLHQQDYQLSVILPNKAKLYKESLGLKSKNDSIDAKGLAQMICEQHLRSWQPISKQIYKLRLLTRQSERLNAMITQLNNQLKALQKGMFRDKSVEKMMERNIALFRKQRAQLEEKIERLIVQDENLNQHYKNICAIKGLGLMTFAVIVAETDGFALIENQAQLVSYAGYDVVENQSGKRVGRTKISKKGNSHIRRILHMPAFNMVAYEQKPFVALYNRIYNRTKIKMKGYTAIQKKLLVLMYTLWKKNEMYDPNYRSPLEMKQPNSKDGLHKMNSKHRNVDYSLSL